MEKIIFTNTLIYEPASVLIGTREPFDKNTLWVHIHDGIVDLKIFNKGWKTILTTKDEGLSDFSLKQVNKLINDFQENVDSRLKKFSGKLSANSLLLMDKLKLLENKVNELEEKLKKLTKKILLNNGK